MSSLIIERLFGNKNLELEVGSATGHIKDKILFIEVVFPKTEPTDGTSDQRLENKSADEEFHAVEAKLELELPIPKGLKEVIGNEFFIDSTDEDNEELTNFYVANTHYPTFDDTILIQQKADGSHWLKWNGKLPDIKSSQYEMYMQVRFKFTLETPIAFSNTSF